MTTKTNCEPQDTYKADLATHLNSFSQGFGQNASRALSPSYVGPHRTRPAMLEIFATGKEYVRYKIVVTCVCSMEIRRVAKWKWHGDYLVKMALRGV